MKGQPPFSIENPQVVEHLSWGAMLRYIETAPVTTTDERASQSERKDSWTGNATFPEAMKLAKDGWTAGETKVRALSRRLETRLLHRIVKEEFNYDVEGTGFDVARFLNGEPEHWLKPEESTAVTDHGTKHVKVVVNVSASCGVSGEAITAKGAAVAALVELLEYGDHRVELWTVDTAALSTNQPPLYANLVRVKAFDQPLEMGRVAFALAHPAMLRRLGFAMMEQSDPSIVRYVTTSNSYGFPTDYKPDETSIYISSSRLWDTAVDWTSPESVEVWVLGQLASQGIILRDE